jgi:hypothetical protein
MGFEWCEIAVDVDFSKPFCQHAMRVRCQELIKDDERAVTKKNASQSVKLHIIDLAEIETRNLHSDCPAEFYEVHVPQ